MALQWFGGYVSPATWANYAIADGVAGLLAYECMEKAQPQLNGRALFQIATSPMGASLECQCSGSHVRVSNPISLRSCSH